MVTTTRDIYIQNMLCIQFPRKGQLFSQQEEDEPFRSLWIKGAWLKGSADEQKGQERLSKQERHLCYQENAWTWTHGEWFRREGFLYRTLYCSHMYSLENFPIGICWNELSQRHSTLTATWKWSHLQWFTVWDPCIKNPMKLRQEKCEVTFISFPPPTHLPRRGLSCDVGHWSNPVSRGWDPQTPPSREDLFSEQDPLRVDSTWRVDAGTKAPWHHWAERTKKVFERVCGWEEKGTHAIHEPQGTPNTSEDYWTWFPLIWVSELFAQTRFTAAERPLARANHSQIPTHEKPIWPTRSTLAYPDAIHWAFQHHCGIR